MIGKRLRARRVNRTGAGGEHDMKFGIHIGHMGGPIGEMRKLWKFADTKGFD